jgi:hypothetical protein
MMQATLFRVAVCVAPLVLWAAPALAYVGPGAGITLLGALWGVLIAIGAALGFLLLWPLRRVLFARRHRPASQAGEDRGHDAMSSAKPGRP